MGSLTPGKKFYFDGRDKLTYLDLRIGMRFRSAGLGGRVYEITALRSFTSYSEVTIRREEKDAKRPTRRCSETRFIL